MSRESHMFLFMSALFLLLVATWFGLRLYVAERQEVRALAAILPTVTPDPDTVVRIYCPDCDGIEIFLHEGIPGQSKVIGRARHGAEAVVVGYQTLDGTLYYRVRVGSVTGWLNSSLVRKP